MAIKVFKPNCNLNTIKDGRGAIYSYVPKQPIMEWTHQYINAGKIRGNHCHPEFDEYILLVEGHGVEVEKNIDTGEERFIQMSEGTCIYIPKGTYHVFMAVTDCKSISFLTKAWDDCDQPIIHENLGYGQGDFGDPNHKYNDAQNLNHKSND